VEARDRAMKKQRLRLASVSKALLDVCPEDGMSLERFMAFTVSADTLARNRFRIWLVRCSLMGRGGRLPERTERDRRAMSAGAIRGVVSAFHVEKNEQLTSLGIFGVGEDHPANDGISGLLRQNCLILAVMERSRREFEGSTMSQVLDGSSTATKPVRRAIQQSLRALPLVSSLAAAVRL
jgi:hypothetical protein